MAVSLRTDTGFQTITAGGTNAATKFASRSSLDSYSAKIGVADLRGETIRLAGAPFENVTAPIQFRLFIQSDITGETLNSTYRLDGCVFNGTVTTVPEPSSMAFLTVAGFAVATVHRRRKRSV